MAKSSQQVLANETHSQLLLHNPSTAYMSHAETRYNFKIMIWLKVTMLMPSAPDNTY